MKASGIVVKTIEHHLRILSRAGLIDCLSDAHGIGVYRLRPQQNPVSKELLRQTCGGELDYYNAATGSERNLRLIHDKDGNRGFVKVNHTPIYD